MLKTKLSPQISAAVSGSLILIANGYHYGWSSPSLAKLQAEDSVIPITSDQGSWIVSCLLIGSIFGSILGVPLVDRLGRKATLLLMSAPLSISCILIAFATNHWWFYLARFIAGVGVGTVFTGIPMYMGEIAEDRVRGGFGVLITVMLNVGFLLSYSIGPWVSTTTLAAVGAVIPVVCVITFVWVPESPYYYAMKSVPYKMEKSLIWLRGTDDVDAELHKIQKSVTLNRNNKGTITELFTVRGNRKALGIVFGLLTCQQVSGNAAIMAYSTIIFNQVDSGISSSISVIITGVVQLVAAILVVFLADKVGRRPLLLTSLALCAFFLFAEALFFHLRANQLDVSLITWLPVVAMIGYLISYSFGIGTVPMAISAEIFPCEVKAMAITLGAVYLCIVGVCVTKFYQIITDAYDAHVAFYTFGCSSIVSMIIIFFGIPETRGFSLSEIQDILNGSSKTKL